MQDVALGSSQITKAEVIELFKLYVPAIQATTSMSDPVRFSEHLYPRLPVLEPELDVGSVQKTHPFLFWTIVITSMKHHPGYTTRVHEIAEAYTDLLSRVIITAPVTLMTVQALLYISTLPVHTQPADPSWNYCGIFVNAARYMGLHRSNSWEGLRSIGIPAANRRARLMTWLGCFVVSTS